MTVIINHVDFRSQTADVVIDTSPLSRDYLQGVSEVYIGKERLNIPQCGISTFKCSAYAVGEIRGRKVLMVKP